MIGLAEIRANAWKIATVTIALVAAAALIFAYAENRNLSKISAGLDRRLNDPVNGEIAKRTQAEANVATLTVSIEKQRVAFQTKAAEDARVLASTRSLLSAAQGETRIAREQVAAFLRHPPQGNTVCEQYEDIDRRGMEDLK